jgi:tetratricopeptide (TPR) repeat protein
MKDVKIFSLLAMLVAGVSLLSAADAQTIPEEARRHLARGQAAVEMAKSPEEYGSAIQEFQEATRLAPSWPVPYYSLALLQEKIGKFKEAVANLKEYLRLAPEAPDAAKIREQIYKLEYKIEQVLTVPDIIAVLASLSDEQAWQVVGECTKDSAEFRRVAFTRDGADAVKALAAERTYPTRTYQTLKVTGPVLKYTTTRNTCSSADIDAKYGGCDAVLAHETEVVSRLLVKVDQKVLREGVGSGVSTGQKFSCTFRKK